MINDFCDTIDEWVEDCCTGFVFIESGCEDRFAFKKETVCKVFDDYADYEYNSSNDDIIIKIDDKEIILQKL